MCRLLTGIPCLSARLRPARRRISTLRDGDAAVHGLKTLVVDDHPTNRRVLMGALRSWKMDPTEAADGRHRGVIARFGRFPHRNALLGRETTPEEAAFLAEGGFAG